MSIPLNVGSDWCSFGSPLIGIIEAISRVSQFLFFHLREGKAELCSLISLRDIGLGSILYDMGRCCFTSPQGEQWGCGTLVKTVPGKNEDTWGCFVRNTIERLNSLLNCSKGAAGIDGQVILKGAQVDRKRITLGGRICNGWKQQESKTSTKPQS